MLFCFADVNAIWVPLAGVWVIKNGATPLLRVGPVFKFCSNLTVVNVHRHFKSKTQIVIAWSFPFHSIYL